MCSTIVQWLLGIAMISKLSPYIVLLQQLHLPVPAHRLLPLSVTGRCSISISNVKMWQLPAGCRSEVSTYLKGFLHNLTGFQYLHIMAVSCCYSQGRTCQNNSPGLTLQLWGNKCYNCTLTSAPSGLAASSKACTAGPVRLL